MARKNFSDLGPWAYAISAKRLELQRHISDWLHGWPFAKQFQEERLPVVVAAQSNYMIKQGPGIAPELQYNKAANISLACSRINGLVIRPGEVFSFWHYVGKTSKRNGFAEGRVIVNGKLVAGTGGGLCNLANTIHLLAMHSPLTIIELHHHSDALAPDHDGKRTPYSAGTSVNYNYIDLRFRNDTAQPVQLCTWCADNTLYAELRTTQEFPTTYRIVEEDHHFRQEANGAYYRNSRIYREVIDRATGKVVDRELKWRNHSKVMYDPALIPSQLLR